jgi:hypothetical protein
LQHHHHHHHIHHKKQDQDTQDDPFAWVHGPTPQPSSASPPGRADRPGRSSDDAR